MTFGDNRQPVTLSGFGFPSDEWVCVELDMTFGDGDASVAVRLNGVETFSASDETYLNDFNQIALGLVAFDDATPSVEYDELIVATGEQLQAANVDAIGCDAP